MTKPKPLRAVLLKDSKRGRFLPVTFIGRYRKPDQKFSFRLVRSTR